MEMVSTIPAEVRRLPAELRSLHVDAGLLRSLSADIPGEFHCLNPSVAVHEGELWATVRVQFKKVPKSRNVIGRIDDGWQIRDARWMRDSAPGPRNDRAHCLGFEDCRLFSWGGRLAACATVCDRIPGDPFSKLAVLELSDVGDVVNVHVQGSRRQEKNWMPFVHGGRLKFVYSFDPFVLMEYDTYTHRVRPAASEIVVPASTIRGSSPLVPYGDGFISIVHTVHTPSPRMSKRVYLHRMAVYDAEGRPVRTSEPFYFERLGLEFCAGLAPWRDSFVLSYGLDDREPKLAIVNKAVVARMIA